MYNAIKIQCDVHQNEYITNFCSNPQCLRPLCPECIEQHTKYHQIKKTIPEIESIKNVKNNCEKKIRQGIQEISKIQDQLDQNEQNDVDDDQLQIIRKAKENILNQVHQFFIQLEDDYRNQMDIMSSEQSVYNVLQDNIRNAMNELEYLQVGIDSNQMTKSIQRICSLDLQSLIQKLWKQFRNLEENPQQITLTIKVNDLYLENIKQSLKKYININQGKQDQKGIQESNIYQQNRQSSQQQYQQQQQQQQQQYQQQQSFSEQITPIQEFNFIQSRIQQNLQSNYSNNY